MRLRRNLLLMLLALSFAGCKPGTVTQSSPATKDASASSDDVLSSALYQVNPENFGINSTMEKPVSLLNSWRIKHAEQQRLSDEPVPVQAPKGWVLDADESRLAQAKYELIDAFHIRDSMLYHVIAGYLSDRARDDVQRVNVIIDFICRNIVLWRDDENELTLPPILSLQLGRGSADDRAWVSMEVLRQMKLDTVIVRSRKDEKQTGDQWLLGVVIDRQIYLYDMQLGLPVPNANGTSTATLAEVTSHPELLNKLAADKPYRMTAEDLTDPTFSVVPDTNYWCHRMKIIEQVLPAKDVCVLYDPLLGEDGRPGVLQRVATVTKVPVEDVKMWKFPHRQLEAARHQTAEMQEELNRMQMALTVPIPIKMNRDNQPEYGQPEFKMQRFRNEHLLGKFAEATKRYLSIRHLVVEPYPPEIDRINRIAAEDAFFWTAICKFEMGDYEEAVNQFSDYIKTYDRKGKWYFAAHALVAQSQAALGKLPEAIKTLERNSADDPYRISNAIRVRRWSATETK